MILGLTIEELEDTTTLNQGENLLDSEHGTIKTRIKSSMVKRKYLAVWNKLIPDIVPKEVEQTP